MSTRLVSAEVPADAGRGRARAPSGRCPRGRPARGPHGQVHAAHSGREAEVVADQRNGAGPAADRLQLQDDRGQAPPTIHGDRPVSVKGSIDGLSAYERSPSRFDLHQPLARQRLNDLARGGLADSVVLADLAQARHLLARLEYPRFDLFLQRSEDPRGGQLGLSGHKIRLPVGL